ncbi:hypothetical protein C9374_000724 [Naegleria lovaniensis]|uniref:Uncharacterized protein n=1 Tax=Naegleria lovaniensis TaxID=51637 RepID=A0AA88GX02_NAELO|nr:uncharacterized protein C9374_000724 [Naegleria lovaniensis]KAG2388560.1 hypothetical protein C9374_000724 [Naegleria lovaniensis]
MSHQKLQVHLNLPTANITFTSGLTMRSQKSINIQPTSKRIPSQEVKTKTDKIINRISDTNSDPLKYLKTLNLQHYQDLGWEEDNSELVFPKIEEMVITHNSQEIQCSQPKSDNAHLNFYVIRLEMDVSSVEKVVCLFTCRYNIVSARDLNESNLGIIVFKLRETRIGMRRNPQNNMTLYEKVLSNPFQRVVLGLVNIWRSSTDEGHLFWLPSPPASGIYITEGDILIFRNNSGVLFDKAEFVTGINIKKESVHSQGDYVYLQIPNIEPGACSLILSNGCESTVAEPIALYKLKSCDTVLTPGSSNFEQCFSEVLYSGQ